jgi:hypothetical protein
MYFLIRCFLVIIAVPLFVNAAGCDTSPICYNEDQLLDKIYAVHATHILPDSDYLRAGWVMEHCSPVQKVLFPQVRATVHFALGELVRPVEGVMDWEDCPFAVVTPLRYLLPQLINVNCYDTFILGDLKLGPDTYLVLPVEIAERVESKAAMVTYDPQTTTLRQAVDELIDVKGGWHIEMKSDDVEDVLHEAYLDGNNVNTMEFFAPIKESCPWLSVGLRFDELDGEHYRLSKIEKGLISVAMPFLSFSNADLELKNSYLENVIYEVNDNFEKWSHFFNVFNWPTDSLRAYQRLARELEKWTILIGEELRIRKVYGKTFFASAPDEFLLEISSFLEEVDLLQNLIDQNIEKLTNYHD